MAEIDIRQIIAAFAEKGWILYEHLKSESSGKPTNELAGPIDNIVPDVTYRILPCADNPLDPDDWNKEFYRAKRAGASCAQYHIPGEDRVGGASHAYLKPAESPVFLHLVFTVVSEGVDLPLEDAAMLIRENLSSYEGGQDGTT